MLRIGLDNEPDSLNPMLSSLQVSVDVSMLWAAYLFHYGDDNRFVPELATEVPTSANGGISKDGRTITYHLRKGVEWQDGVPFGADDVIFSWRQVMNPRNAVPSRLGYDDVETIAKIDDHTVSVRLKRPYAPFVSTFFSMCALTYPILPKHLLGDLPDLNHAAYNAMPVGTGPYRVVSYRHGQDLKLVANDGYWRGRPGLREVYVTFVQDQDTLLNQLRSHELDLVTNVSLARVLSARNIDGTALYAIPFTYFTYLGFNTSRPPFDDARVRRAFAMGFDKRKLLDDVTHGYSLDADSDQPPFSWAHAGGLPPLPYDPARAAALLGQARWNAGADGFRYRGGHRLDAVMVSTAGSATYREAEQILQSEWRALGVNLTVKNLPDDVLYAPASEGGILSGGKYDVYVNGWFNGVDPDDSPMFSCSQASPAGDNYTRFCNAAVDKAEQAALASYDESVRKAAYARIQHALRSDVPADFLWFARRVDIANSDLKNYRPAHAVTTFWNAWAWRI